MLNQILSFVTGIVATVVTLFIPKTTPSITPTPTQTIITAESVVTLSPTPRSAYYIAEKTIQEQGKEVTIRMELDRNTNTITGTITGDCKGTITGSLRKPSEPIIDYLVSGSANGTCLFVIPTSATFDGQLRLNWGGEYGNSVLLHITANIFGSTFKRDIFLPITNL